MSTFDCKQGDNYGEKEDQIATSASLAFGFLAMTFFICVMLYVIARP